MRQSTTVAVSSIAIYYVFCTVQYNCLWEAVTVTLILAARSTWHLPHCPHGWSAQSEWAWVSRRGGRTSRPDLGCVIYSWSLTKTQNCVIVIWTNAHTLQFLSLWYHSQCTCNSNIRKLWHFLLVQYVPISTLYCMWWELQQPTFWQETHNDEAILVPPPHTLQLTAPLNLLAPLCSCKLCGTLG